MTIQMVWINKNSNQQKFYISLCFNNFFWQRNHSPPKEAINSIIYDTFLNLEYTVCIGYYFDCLRYIGVSEQGFVSRRQFTLMHNPVCIYGSILLLWHTKGIYQMHYRNKKQEKQFWIYNLYTQLYFHVYCHCALALQVAFKMQSRCHCHLGNNSKT